MEYFILSKDTVGLLPPDVVTAANRFIRRGETIYVGAEHRISHAKIDAEVPNTENKKIDDAGLIWRYREKLYIDGSSTTLGIGAVDTPEREETIRVAQQNTENTIPIVRPRY